MASSPQSPSLSTSSSSSGSGMGAERAPYTQLDWLPDTVPTYVCAGCGAHLALQDELISKAFSGRDGKAYLFNSTLNTTMGPKEDRTLLTGVHTVCDLRCKGCSSTLGWTYLRAFESSQKYKEGKSIMEKIALVKSNNW